MTPGEPKEVDRGWECPCGKPMHCQYVVAYECAVWRCPRGHRWGQLFAANVKPGESAWQRIGLPRKVAR